MESETSDYNIEILGINWNLDNDLSNDLMTAGRDLPWLQDTSVVNAQASCGAAYRDVVILDAWNRPVEPAFNLTSHDLSIEANRNALKERLRQAAVLVDSDGDRIGDDWEERFLGGLGEGPVDDTDYDGDNHLMEYAFGSHPGQSVSLPVLETGTMTVEGEEVSFLRFRQRLGLAGGLEYFPETSDSGNDWSDDSQSWTVHQRENSHDGTGTEIVTLIRTGSVDTSALFRIRVGFPVAVE